MKRAGLSYQTAHPRHYKADPVEQQRWRAEFKKVADAEGGGLPDRRHRSEHAGEQDQAKARVVSREFPLETASGRRYV